MTSLASGTLQLWLKLVAEHKDIFAGTLQTLHLTVLHHRIPSRLRRLLGDVERHRVVFVTKGKATSCVATPAFILLEVRMRLDDIRDLSIREHRSGPDATTAASEANAVINRFDLLPDSSKQDLLNFLRSL